MAANDNLYGSKIGTYSSGGVITHTLFNTEFNAIANSFHATNGHNHDGTTGAGAPITTLYGNVISIGTGGTSNITLNFNTDSNDGQIAWMRSSDYFYFTDDILIPSTEKIYFRDTDLYINSSLDGYLDINSNNIVAITAITTTVSNNLKLKSDNAVLGFGVDNEVTITHIPDTGLRLEANDQLQFRSANSYITSTFPNQLDFIATELVKTSGGLATTPVTLTGAGGALAVDITESQMFLNTGSGTTTLTMATPTASHDGQQMRITMEVAGNNATMSASDGNLVTSQASSITWDAVGESVDFVYSESLSKWLIVNVHGATLS
jgi:hypothetical protein